MDKKDRAKRGKRWRARKRRRANRERKGEQATETERERKRRSVTYHDRQHRVDFPDVVLILVEDVDGYARLLAAETAHAARLEGLHAARCSLSLSALTSLAKHATSSFYSPRAPRRDVARARLRSSVLSGCSFLCSYLRLALVCIRALLRRSQKVRSM